MFHIKPLVSTAKSAAAYVPMVVAARGLAFLRTLLVGKLLGDLGQAEFGLYQPGLELINWIVPLVMFGLGDVAERYASRFQREGRLQSEFHRHLTRLLMIGIAIALLMLAASPWIGRFVWNTQLGKIRYLVLVGWCAGTIVALALYQYIAAMLRGLRAYGASAGMEILSAMLLLLLSAIAAWHGTAGWLLAAYMLSVGIPMLLYGWKVRNYISEAGTVSHASPADPSSAPVELNANVPAPTLEYAQGEIGLSTFARWTLLRLLFVMTFGFLSIWSVGYLFTHPSFGIAGGLDPRAPSHLTAQFSMPFRIAQLLAYLAVTLWASAYGIAARSWSHDRKTRAKVQLLRVGKFGVVAMALAAALVLWSRGLLALLLPAAYSDAIENLLPPLLAIFWGYGLLSFAATFGDLQERPWVGAYIWGTAVFLQAILILIPINLDASSHALLAAGSGIAVALYLLVPILLWRPFKMSATAVPLLLMSLLPITFFSPNWVVDWIAGPAVFLVIAFLWISNLLIRPIDKRWLRKRFFTPRIHETVSE